MGRNRIGLVLGLGLALGLALGANAQGKLGTVVGAKTPVKSTAPAPAPGSALELFTVKDLTAALADAQTSGDTLAANCYTALIPAVQNPGLSITPKGLGAFQAFQKARDINRLANAGVPDGLKIACGPLVLDAQTTIVLLAAKVGIAVPGLLLAKSGLGIIGASGLAMAGAQLRALP